MTTLTIPDELHTVAELAHRYQSCITDRWRHLHFTPSGAARVSSIMGWILGLSHGGRGELAGELAADLFERLDYLNGYGGMDSTPDGKHQFPRYRVALTDDGTLHGFALAWHLAYIADAKPLEDNSDVPALTFYNHFDRVTVRYKYASNGGLLYHGPGGGEVFAVTVGTSRPWSIHT